jgi:hypothetical protein
MVLQDIAALPYHYTVSQPRRLQLESSVPWKPQILHGYISGSTQIPHSTEVENLVLCWIGNDGYVLGLVWLYSGAFSCRQITLKSYSLHSNSFRKAWLLNNRGSTATEKCLSCCQNNVDLYPWVEILDFPASDIQSSICAFWVSHVWATCIHFGATSSGMM